MVLVGAVAIYGESLNWLQWVGIVFGFCLAVLHIPRGS